MGPSVFYVGEWKTCPSWCITREWTLLYDSGFEFIRYVRERLQFHTQSKWYCPFCILPRFIRNYVQAPPLSWDSIGDAQMTTEEITGSSLNYNSRHEIRRNFYQISHANKIQTLYHQVPIHLPDWIIDLWLWASHFTRTHILKVVNL